MSPTFLFGNPYRFCCLCALVAAGKKKAECELRLWSLTMKSLHSAHGWFPSKVKIEKEILIAGDDHLFIFLGSFVPGWVPFVNNNPTSSVSVRSCGEENTYEDVIARSGVPRGTRDGNLLSYALRLLCPAIRAGLAKTFSEYGLCPA
jgi:hypothetical protein